MNGRVRGALASLALFAAACGGAAPKPDAAFASAELAVEVSLPGGAPHLGANTLRLRVRDAQGRAVDDAAVEVDYRMDMPGQAPMGGRVAAAPRGGGEYEAEIGLDMSGTWQLALAATRPSGASARAQGSLRTGAAGLRLEAPGAGAAAPPSAGAPPASGGTEPPGTVHVDEARAARIGVRFANAQRAPLVRRLRATGTVAWDESRVVDVTTKLRGFVRELHAATAGAAVNRGDVLLEVYSPELLAAQQEYLDALAAQRAARAGDVPERAGALAAAAAARLRLWDVAPADLERAVARGAPLEVLPLRAPASGYLVEKNVAAGAAIEPGQRLFRIAPLGRVWVDAELLASDLPLVREGQRARVSSAAAPGRSFDARVAYVYPALRGVARAARLRLELDNPDAVLRPEMYVDVELEADLGERLLVPASAVIFAGARRVVFVDLGGGRLAPRDVATGESSEESIEILSGLAEGERVVASGNFLIAAESRLRSALEAW